MAPVAQEACQAPLRDRFRGLLADPEAALVMPAVLEVCRAASKLGVQDNGDVKMAVRKVARAEGLLGTRDALLELSAVALRASASLPESTARIPTHIGPRMPTR